MYGVIADGIPWKDADGRTEWDLAEASALADMLENSLGYEVYVYPACHQPGHI